METLFQNFGDTPHGLKTSGFWTVTSPDVFSQLPTSYAGMRTKPYARGGCHRPNYVGDTKFPTMLVSDIHGSDAITMPTIATFLARPVASCRTALLAVSTSRTSATGVALFLEHHLHPASFSFVREQMASVAC